MKTRFAKQSGFTLIECMVYIAILAIVLTISMTAYSRCAYQSTRLQKVAADISGVLDAGETWRADVRRSTGDIIAKTSLDEQKWTISQPDGSITYVLRDGTLTRSRNGTTVALLKNVKACDVVKDVRKHVTGWRWELELRSGDKNARVRPIFSFQAVSGGGTK